MKDEKAESHKLITARVRNLEDRVVELLAEVGDTIGAQYVSAVLLTKGLGIAFECAPDFKQAIKFCLDIFGDTIENYKPGPK